MRIVHNPDASEQDDSIASATKRSLDRSGMTLARPAKRPRPEGNTVSITGGILSPFDQFSLYIRVRAIPGDRFLKYALPGNKTKSYQIKPLFSPGDAQRFFGSHNPARALKRISMVFRPCDFSSLG